MNEAQPHDKISLFIGFIRTKCKQKQNLHRNVKYNNHVDWITMHELASTLRPELVKYLSQNHNQHKSKPIYSIHSREARADDTAATPKGPSRNLFGEILDRGAAALSGATKKRKNVAPAKPAPKSKKASTRPPSRPRKPTKDVPANEPQAPDEGAEANAVTPGGHA